MGAGEHCHEVGAGALPRPLLEGLCNLRKPEATVHQDEQGVIGEYVVVEGVDHKHTKV